ncbi:molybdopterin-guanine dinucleotide biosynthesis protein B [Cupriavidus sp. 2TAF22]|uniref:molybdopterin-guanine dinucleotide biosynthesis protein B n=1 Tax=unclassified Cupriavidus TaxID=2640874 RepID=UPI003F8E60BC
MRVIGLSGASGAGKTTLISKVIPALKARGLTVSTLKHAHDAFDVDRPGKDSYVHRQAGASEVLVASSVRWALMHEFTEQATPTLSSLLQHLRNVDLVIVEGFRAESYAKVEIFRDANDKPWMYPHDPDIVAVISDTLSDISLPHAHLDNAGEAADLVFEYALPIEETLRRLATAVVPDEAHAR